MWLEFLTFFTPNNTTLPGLIISGPQGAFTDMCSGIMNQRPCKGSQRFLMSSLTLWCGVAQWQRKGQWAVKFAHKINGYSLPFMADIYTTNMQGQSPCILHDNTHATHKMLIPLHTGCSLPCKKFKIRKQLVLGCSHTVDIFSQYHTQSEILSVHF